MVKIISKGVKTVTCFKCESVLEYGQDEVKRFTTNWDYIGDHDIVYGIECPICNTLITDK